MFSLCRETAGRDAGAPATDSTTAGPATAIGAAAPYPLSRRTASLMRHQAACRFKEELSGHYAATLLVKPIRVRGGTLEASSS